jgi:hypothetical protein
MPIGENPYPSLGKNTQYLVFGDRLTDKIINPPGINPFFEVSTTISSCIQGNRDACQNLDHAPGLYLVARPSDGSSRADRKKAAGGGLTLSIMFP